MAIFHLFLGPIDWEIFFQNSNNFEKEKIGIYVVGRYTHEGVDSWLASDKSIL